MKVYLHFFIFFWIFIFSLEANDSICKIASLTSALEDHYLERTDLYSLEEIDDLWYVNLKNETYSHSLQEAYKFYCLNEKEKAFQALSKIWLEAIEEKTASENLAIASYDLNNNSLKKGTDKYPNFYNNPLMTKKEKELTKPYLIPLDHPLKYNLDAVFGYQRVTLTMETLLANQFILVKKAPRSFIKVVKHPALQGYLLKLYTDDTLQVKKNIPGWRWLIYRCKGAKKVRHIIREIKSKYFVAPHKWIFPLPFQFAPVQSEKYDQKHTLLVVDEMPIVSTQESTILWREVITKSHLDELYKILSYASSIRSRPDNMCFTVTGLIALIDTEYPFSSPDFRTVRPYLSEGMRIYWDKLIKGKN